jgi:predicted esterase YcpF (UPF0227 family)
MTARATLVYLHGFRSSPASAKARALVDAVAALPEPLRPCLHVPALHYAPLRAIAEVQSLVDAAPRDGPLTFIGSSLGGYYATWLAEHYKARAALVNPAVHPYTELAAWRGMQTNLYTGETFEVTAAHFDELRALRVDALADPARYFLLQQSGDELLDWRIATARYAGAWQLVEGGGDHAFTTFAAHLPEVLRFACERP